MYPTIDTIRETPKPYSNIPFRQDQAFVDRGDILTYVEQRCSQPAGRAALVGLGGVGKSQLAIEYAHRVRKQSPETWIFWVYAATTARIEAAYKSIANMVELPGRQETSTGLMQLVYDWLSREANGKWLIVVDNADDEMTMDSQNGRDVVKKLVGYPGDIIDVLEMTQQEANKLLEKKLLKQLDTLGPQLLDALDYIPLTITQAVAYINDLHSRDLVLQYLEEIQTIRGKMSLDENISPDVRRDECSSNSVFATWQISFEHIRAKRPSAADLLSFMSFFHRQGIPEFMFHHYEDKNEDEQDGADEKEENTNAEEQSKSSHQRKRNSNACTTSLDQSRPDILVQSATRMWLKSSNLEGKWSEKSIEAMAREFPAKVEYENWSICPTLFPHVQSLTGSNPLAQRQILPRAKVLTEAAWYALKQGLFVQAEAMIRISVHDHAKELGDEDQITLKSNNLLAIILRLHGKYEAAGRLNWHVLAKMERLLGKEHPDTLTSVENLITIQFELGKYDEAENLGQQAVAGREKILGKEHFDTLLSVSNLALTLFELGRYNEVENLGQRAVTGRETLLGKEHPNTLKSLANLGYILCKQQKSGAEEMIHRALEAQEKALGKEHPNTLWSAENLAYILEQHRHYDESINLYKRVCDGVDRVYGASHPRNRVYRERVANLLPSRTNN
ncbi:MAG: hypothetical protein Q9165_003660 [Trypethelium subeluteriae]